MSSLRLRASTPEYGPAIRALLAAAFPENPKTDPDIFRWQYQDNPFGSAIGMVWESDGRIVSHLARLPVPMRLGGNHVKGAISVDAATAPEYRGRGVFVELVGRLNEHCADRGLATTVSWLPSRPDAGPTFPRARSLVRALVRPVSAQWWRRSAHVPHRAARAAARVLRPRDAGSAVVTDDVPDVDDIWAVLEPKVVNGIVRTTAWWRWRYGRHPRRPYRYAVITDAGSVTGAAAFVVRPMSGLRVACLLEVTAIRRDTAFMLLSAITSCEPNIDAIASRACDGTVAMDLAQAAGLWRVPRRFERAPMTVNSWALSSEVEEASTHAWNMSWGDMDSV